MGTKRSKQTISYQRRHLDEVRHEKTQQLHRIDYSHWRHIQYQVVREAKTGIEARWQVKTWVARKCSVICVVTINQLDKHLNGSIVVNPKLTLLGKGPYCKIKPGSAVFGQQELQGECKPRGNLQRCAPRCAKCPRPYAIPKQLAVPFGSATHCGDYGSPSSLHQCQPAQVKSVINTQMQSNCAPPHALHENSIHEPS